MPYPYQSTTDPAINKTGVLCRSRKKFQPVCKEVHGQVTSILAKLSWWAFKKQLKTRRGFHVLILSSLVDMVIQIGTNGTLTILAACEAEIRKNCHLAICLRECRENASNVLSEQRNNGLSSQPMMFYATSNITATP